MPEMDLNALPDDVPGFFSFLDIRVVCRKKADNREVLIRKYGERGYDAILHNEEPVILIHVSNTRIILFVLYN